MKDFDFKDLLGNIRYNESGHIIGEAWDVLGFLSHSEVLLLRSRGPRDEVLHQGKRYWRQGARNSNQGGENWLSVLQIRRWVCEATTRIISFETN